MSSSVSRSTLGVNKNISTCADRSNSTMLQKKSPYTASLNTFLFSCGLQCLECASLSLS